MLVVYFIESMVGFVDDAFGEYFNNVAVLLLSSLGCKGDLDRIGIISWLFPLFEGCLRGLFTKGGMFYSCETAFLSFAAADYYDYVLE